MKRWAVFTVAIYAAALLVLTTPALLIAFGRWAKNPVGFDDALHAYSYYGYWLWLAVLIAGQALFLLVPIDIAERRLPARRPVRIPVIVTAFFLANLLVSGLLAVASAILKDAGLEFFPYLSPSHYWVLFNVENHDNEIFLGMAVCLLVFWTLWAFVFGRFAKSDDPEAFLHRATRWLLRGSVLELLVAIPSHIIVRRREDCCAPIGTFWGIASGISVMLLCFGPGVFFLFVERFRRLQPKSNR